jgi:hypothetical protein
VDELLDAFRISLTQCKRIPEGPEESRSDLVHPNVGALSGKNGRGQQFIRVAVI